MFAVGIAIAALATGYGMLLMRRIGGINTTIYDAARDELVWVDIEAGRLLHADPDRLDAATETTIGDMLGAAVPALGGGWILAAGRGQSALAPYGMTTPLAELEPAGNRMNDGACEPQGRFRAGSMALDERPGGGGLHRLDADGTVTTVLSGGTIANGLG
jgi:sugar lactone lactonase YvrE